MKKVIKIAADRRASRLRAKKRIEIFDQEQEWFQHAARYDDAPTSTPTAMRLNSGLKPLATKFNRPWIQGAKSSHGWKRRVVALVSVPFWEAAKRKKDAELKSKEK